VRMLVLSPNPTYPSTEGQTGGVLLRLQQLTGGQLKIQQSSLYPALYRLEHRGFIA